jgi:hypothetical protein
MRSDPNVRLAGALFPRLAVEQIQAAMLRVGEVIGRFGDAVRAARDRMSAVALMRARLLAAVRAERKRRQHVIARQARRRAGGSRVRTTSPAFRAGTRKTRQHTR